jgi:hypothetical protein
MRRPKRLLLLLALLFAPACGHDRASTPPGAPHSVARNGEPGREAHLDSATDEGVRIKGNSLNSRILALMGRGEFAEAQMLIAEGTAAGSISHQVAQRLLHRIALLNTKLGEVPASIQRAKNFPSQLRDYTLFQIERMLMARDYSIATQAQLNMATKLIEQQPRLMSKAQ